MVVVLLKLARRHGRMTPRGVEVSVSHRVLALAATTSRKTVGRILGRSTWLQKGEPGSGKKSGTLVLLPPLGGFKKGRAKRPHSNHRGSIESKPTASGDTLRGPFSAPRLRWSAPGILRLGKTAEAAIDYLESLGGRADIRKLGELLHVNSKRLRDFRRRVVARLAERGIVSVMGDTVTLVDNWLEALNVERVAMGEIAAYRRDLVKFNCERKAYASRHKHLAEKAPSDAELERQRKQRVADALEILQTRNSGPYMILRTYLTGETRFDYVVHAVAYYYDFSSPEAWRSAVERAVQLIAGASAQGA
jgi:hypothetical protein